MKVLIVRDRKSSGGGIANYYNAVSPHLKVDHIFSNVARPHCFYGERIPFVLRNTPIRLLIDWLALIWKILTFGPDIVHVNPGLDPSTGRALKRDAICVLIARFFRCRVLVFWRGWDNSWCGKPEFPGGKDGWIHGAYQQAAAHVVLASRFEEDLRRWGFTAPVHLETTLVSDECLQNDDSRENENLETINLLFLSRIELAKGVFELLDTYQILKNENPNYTLTIAGDGPAMVELQERANQLKLDDISYPGFVSGKDKTDSFRKGTIFCFLSYTEGMPNAVLEAMSFGLPIVSSDAGGLRDILTDGENGFVILSRNESPLKEKFDPEEVADRIRRLAQDRELRERISSNNRRYARETFAADKVAARLKDIYRSLHSPDPILASKQSDPLLPHNPLK